MNEPHDEMRWLTGRCACGAVEYRVADAFEYAQNCHCSNCRRATGSAFKPFGGIRPELFSVVSGGDSLMKIGEDQDHDVRCAQCGSYLCSIVQNGEYIHVAYGTLTDTPTLRPEAHIFVGSKAKWFEITDCLPQYEEFPNSGA